MPIYHDVAQYSEAHDRLKLGIPTSSNFHKIITPQGKPSKQWREYACLLIAERLLRRPDETFIKALDRELQIFNYFIESVIEKIRTTYEVSVPQGGLALKAALRASLETLMN